MDKIIIQSKGKIIALIFKKSLKAHGVNFLTPVNYSLQLGLIEHPKGTVIREHIHNPNIKYEIDTTQEFLYIETGKVKVKFFDNGWNYVGDEILTAGDFMLHVNGGHGFEILEKTKMIEVKQGPYPGDKIAKIFRDE